MTQIEKAKVTAAIQAVATKDNKSIEEIRQVMQEALDIAWANAWQAGNLRAQVIWQRLFPGGEKPTVEEFIHHLTQTSVMPGEEPCG